MQYVKNQKILSLTLTLLVGVFSIIGSLLVTPVAKAAPESTDKPTAAQCQTADATTPGTALYKLCHGTSAPTTPTSTPTCSEGNTDACTGSEDDPAASCTSSNCDLIKKYINPLIAFLAAIVGIAVTISIIVGAIQYSASAGDPQKATLAKKRITNAVIALVAFFFLYWFLQWLVPGGII